MRENHLETPQREHPLVNRRSVSMSSQFKKSHKPMIAKSSVAASAAAAGDVSATKSEQDSTVITDSAGMIGKSLNADFAAVAGDVSAMKSEKDSTVITESAGMIGKRLNVEFAAAAGEASATKDSTVITESAAISNQSSRIGAVETEMLVKRLRELRVHVLNSSEVNSMSKKLLDTLVSTVIEDFESISGDREGLGRLNIPKKALVVLLSFLLWVLLIFVVLLSVSSGRQLYVDLKPS